MRVYVRKYRWYRDLFFQCHVLFDESIQHIMFDNLRKTLGYFMPGRFYEKYVVVMEQESSKERRAVCAFLKDPRKDVCWIAGFVPTRMQNKGMGVYGAVAGINELFKKHPSCTVLSASYAHNKRAIRVTTALGFRLYVNDDRHYEGSMTKAQFDNDFVKRIMRRCNIQ